MVTAKHYSLSVCIMEGTRSELELASAFIDLNLKEETDINPVIKQVKGNILIRLVQQRRGTMRLRVHNWEIFFFWLGAILEYLHHEADIWRVRRSWLGEKGRKEGSKAEETCRKRNWDSGREVGAQSKGNKGRDENWTSPDFAQGLLDTNKSWEIGCFHD